MQKFSENVKHVFNEELGSHLVAAIDIEPGDIILEEQPLLITTHWEFDQLKCAKCCEDSFVMCRQCQFFPLCMDCSDHDKFDCDFFQTKAKNISKNLLINNFAINAVLKLLLLMENPDTKEQCQALVPQNFKLNEYRDSDMWQEHEENIVQPLIESGIMNTLQVAKKSNCLDADLLHKLCIVLDANAFEVSSKVSSDSLKGLYVHAAKMPHNCVPNAATSIDDDYNMRIYAGVAIKAGEIIYNCFTNPLMGTIQRQQYLQMTRRFQCKCSRCLDPTELGTHMSSLKCKQCSDGYVLYNSSKWLCEQCKTIMDPVQVQKLLTEVSEAIAKVNGNIIGCEELLQKYADDFHPNHFLMLDLKQNVATLLRTILMNPMCHPSKEVLERRVDLCAEILPVVRAVIPGYSKLYAIGLYEYLLTFMELAEMDFRRKDITKEIYCKNLQVAKEIANEAKELLSFEPTNSPEGHLVRRLSIQQEQIEQTLKKVSKK